MIGGSWDGAYMLQEGALLEAMEAAALLNLLDDKGEVFREVGCKQQGAIASQGTRRMRQKPRSNEAAFIMPLLVPGIGKVDMNSLQAG